MTPTTMETGTTFMHAITYEKRGGEVIRTTICGEPENTIVHSGSMVFCPMCEAKMRQGAATIPYGLAALLPEYVRTPEIVVPKHYLS